MQVAITSRHGLLRDDVRQYIEQKAEKLLTYFERVTAIEVTVDFEKDRTKVELLVNTEHRHDLVAREVGEDVMGAFDRVLAKMEQQIKRYKEKLQDHRRDRSVNEVATAEPGEAEDVE